MKRTLLSTAACFASLLFAPLAKADSAGISFAATGPVMNNATGYSLGYQFTANTDLTVTALGYFDNGGLQEVHQVGLYNAYGALLATASVDGSGLQDGFFNYSAIAPITLQAGQSYEVMGNSGMLDSYTFDTLGLAVNPDITLVRDVFAMGNALQFGSRSENIDAAHGGAFFGANVEIATTPEPGGLLLLSSGLPGLVALAKRRRFA